MDGATTGETPPDFNGSSPSAGYESVSETNAPMAAGQMGSVMPVIVANNGDYYVSLTPTPGNTTTTEQSSPQIATRIPVSTSPIPPQHLLAMRPQMQEMMPAPAMSSSDVLPMMPMPFQEPTTVRDLFSMEQQADDLAAWMSMPTAQTYPQMMQPIYNVPAFPLDGFLEDEFDRPPTLADDIKSVVNAVNATANVVTGAATAVGGVVSSVAHTGVSVAKGISSYVQGPISEEPVMQEFNKLHSPGFDPLRGATSAGDLLTYSPIRPLDFGSLKLSLIHISEPTRPY